MYNKAIIIGQVCSEIKSKTIDNGTLVSNFRVETSDNHKQYHTINCYDKTAHISQELTQGDYVFVEGRVVTRSYLDKNNEKKYVTTINAARVSMIGDKNEQTSTDTFEEAVGF